MQTSTFGAEFAALKQGVELMIALRCHLRALGVHVTKPTPIFVDNVSVFLDAANPSSSLNMKAVALAYHFVREHQSGKVVSIRKISSTDNHSDPLTKNLNSTASHDFLYEFMTN